MAGLSPEIKRAIDLRRSRGGHARDIRIEWFIKEVSDKVSLTMKKRTQLATVLILDKVVRNIGVAVKKEKGPKGGIIVTKRSVAGEFPRADTEELQKSIFYMVEKIGRGDWIGFVGTTLDYGLILETKMNRSFLVRTLNENRANVNTILSGPIK